MEGPRLLLDAGDEPGGAVREAPHVAKVPGFEPDVVEVDLDFSRGIGEEEAQLVDGGDVIDVDAQGLPARLQDNLFESGVVAEADPQVHGALGRVECLEDQVPVRGPVPHRKLLSGEVNRRPAAALPGIVRGDPAFTDGRDDEPRGGPAVADAVRVELPAHRRQGRRQLPARQLFGVLEIGEDRRNDRRGTGVGCISKPRGGGQDQGESRDRCTGGHGPQARAENRGESRDQSARKRQGSTGGSEAVSSGNPLLPAGSGAQAGKARTPRRAAAGAEA